MGRKVVWTREAEESMRAMRARGMKLKDIGRHFGISKAAVHHRLNGRASTHVTSPMNDKPKPVKKKKGSKPEPVIESSGERVESAKNARRGFEIPKMKYSEYIDLLKTGMSIDDARRRLGL